MSLARVYKSIRADVTGHVVTPHSDGHHPPRTYIILCNEKDLWSFNYPGTFQRQRSHDSCLPGMKHVLSAQLRPFISRHKVWWKDWKVWSKFDQLVLEKGVCVIWLLAQLHFSVYRCDRIVSGRVPTSYRIVTLIWIVKMALIHHNHYFGLIYWALCHSDHHYHFNL